MMDVRDAAIGDAALRRLGALAAIDDAATAALTEAVRNARAVRINSELLADGEPITRPILILHGWAARARTFADGRRQILSVLLPGELIGLCAHRKPRAVANVIAATDMLVCAAPSAADSAALADAYATSRALDEAYLLAQIARIGRLTAHERICDLMLELHERLDMAGLTMGDGFDMPLTQEKVADLLGLTPVHVNRMLQQSRKDGELSLKSGRLRFADRALLARQLGRGETRVSHDR